MGYLKAVVSNSNVCRNQVDNISDWVYGVVVLDARACALQTLGTVEDWNLCAR